MLDIEKKHWENGAKHIAGIDEVGRGPLCGPVVACAVILPQDIDIDGITDSKKLTPKNREKLFQIIKEKATSIGIGMVHEDRIDEINILQATMEAMNIAIDNLSISPDFLLVDGNMKRLCKVEQESVVKGDQKSMSIAAASIVAKVTRDAMMAQYDRVFPGYGMARNMGYGTKEHMEALKEKFSTPIHRQSFSPVDRHMPTFADVGGIDRLSIRLAASELVKAGHEIHVVGDPDSCLVDILTSLDGRLHSYHLQRENAAEAGPESIRDEAQALAGKMDLKKDITKGIDISVISVKFSKVKPKVTFRKV